MDVYVAERMARGSQVGFQYELQVSTSGCYAAETVDTERRSWGFSTDERYDELGPTATTHRSTGLYQQQQDLPLKISI